MFSNGIEIEDHLSLPMYAIKKSLSPGMLTHEEREDLLQDLYVCLVQTAKRYNPSYGTTFSTYALSYMTPVIKTFLKTKRDMYHGMKIGRDISYEELNIDTISLDMEIGEEKDSHVEDIVEDKNFQAIDDITQLYDMEKFVKTL